MDSKAHPDHDGDRSDQGTHHSRPGAGSADRPALLDIERSIRPGTPVPVTLLVADMGDGALLLQGWRTGPSAYLTPDDALPVRQALAAAFGSDPLGTDPGQAAAEQSLRLPTDTVEPDWTP